MSHRKIAKSLPPSPPGHGDFWATVHVKLRIPVPDQDDPAATPVQGYYRNFGIRAVPNRVHQVLAELVTDGVIDWSETEWSLVDPNTLKREIRSCIEPVAGEGVWYQSGHVYYADPDLEPLPS